MLMSGHPARSSSTSSMKSPIVYFLRMPLRTASLPLCTGMWTNLYILSSSMTPRMPSTTLDRLSGLVMPSLILNSPSLSSIERISVGRSVPMSLP